MRAKHYLKTWPEVFEKVLSGEKTFEVRKNDRDFRVGDLVKLNEFNPITGYSKRETAWLEIVYILPGGQFGIAEGYVVMQLKPVVYFNMV